MKKDLIIKLVTLILSMLKPEVLVRIADKILDAIEDAVKDSPNKIDDIMVIPLCNKVRDAFGIEDND